MLKARIWFMKTIKRIDNDSSLLPIARARAQCGDREGARETLDLVTKISRERRDTQYLGYVVECQAELGFIEDTRSLATEIAAEMGTWTYQAIVNQQCERGHIAGAVETAAMIKSLDLKACAVAAIASARLKRGDKAGWERDIREFLGWKGDLVELMLLKINFNPEYCGNIALALAEGGEFEAAEALAMRSGSGRLLVLLGLIARERIRHGDYAGALKDLGKVKGDHYGFLSKALATAWVQSGNLKGLEEWIGSLRKAENRFEASLAAAEALNDKAHPR